MRLLVITSLFPNTFEPSKGIFSKNTLDPLGNYCQMDVICPIPWFPKSTKLRKIYQDNYHRNFGALIEPEKVRSEKTAHNYTVYYPQYFSIPRIGFAFLGFFYFLSMKKILSKNAYDAILGLWLYPDCFSAVLASKYINRPLISVALGSDVNELCKNPVLIHMIKYVLKGSRKVIVVSQDLKTKVLDLNPHAKDRVKIITNGTNLNQFRPMNKKRCRQELGLSLQKKIILFVGNLIEIKGVDILAQAFAEYSRNCTGDDVDLILVGEGNLRGKLEKIVSNSGLDSNVFFAGRQAYEKIPIWMNAADLVCLPSLNEGCPNVLLEANACGSPIVATSVGGIPEIVKQNMGILVPPGDGRELKKAFEKALTKNWDNRVRIGRSWEAVGREYFEEIQSVIH